MEYYREYKSADTLDDIRAAVRLEHDVQIHNDPLVVLIIARTPHLLNTHPTYNVRVASAAVTINYR